MNPLESLKERLKIKPKVEARQPVAIIINKEPLKLNENVEKVKIKETPKMTIIDERDKGFDRQKLLNRLTESKINKVTIKPVLKAAIPEPIFEASEMPVTKKAKKIKQKNRLIIEEDEEEQGEIQEPTKNKRLIIEEEEGEYGDQVEEAEQVPIIIPEKAVRKTKKIERGIAVLGPEIVVDFGETELDKRLPKKEAPFRIIADSYYMNNREKFISFINALFYPYRQEIEENSNSISCDTIGQGSTDFSLLTHQLIVRDYMNLYTPYRGLLLYHGLGSGKTCTSIAIAEGMKDFKRVIVMTPKSLRSNYMSELKKCGDLIYKKNQYWEWVSTELHPEALDVLSSVLKLTVEYITKRKGAWFVNITKPSNYSELTTNNKRSLDEQLDTMIQAKYFFINYNGLRTKKLEEYTNGFTKNLFDNSVVIIDEAHNLISRIVNKIKKEKPVAESNRGEKEHSPKYLSVKLYEYLLSAKNAKIVLLTGTPVINYPNEFGILFNILRGYIKTWEIPLNVKTSNKIDKDSLSELLMGEKSLDYLDYSSSSKVLTITRNPFGFKNKIKIDTGYQGITNKKKDDKGKTNIETDFISDEDFERKIISILKRNDIEVLPSGIKIRNKKALPDSFDLFEGQYIDSVTKQIKNTDALKKRIIGLSSYFRSAQESLLPRFNKTLGVDYHVVRINMSNFQFQKYEAARVDERKTEKPKKTAGVKDLYEESTSTYKIFSRLFCNFVMPNRPMPLKVRQENAAKYKEDHLEEYEEHFETNLQETLANLQRLNEQYEAEGKPANYFWDIPRFEAISRERHRRESKEGQKELHQNLQNAQIEQFRQKINKDLQPQFDKLMEEAETHEEKEVIGQKKTNLVETILTALKKKSDETDMNDENEGEVEGDELLEKLGGLEYKDQLNIAIKHIEEHSNDFLTPEALQTYSPKFLHMLENITDPQHMGLHLIYSQFRTLEGVGIFSLVLEKNGFARFKIRKNDVDSWEIDISEDNYGKPMYALYTGTETPEEKEIIRNIYNGDWNYIPTNIANELKMKANNNNMGEIIKVLMITSSGSEGINLMNTRYVHIMEPYWHQVRTEQVIGRARRICSHKNLPVALQTVEVFIYLMVFTAEQLESDDAIELKRKDLSKSEPKFPVTSDQLLYEISEIKGNINRQLTDIIIQSSIDCQIYSNGKCIDFGDTTNKKFSYVPDYSEQQSDIIVQSNKSKIEWTGKPISLNGVDYVYRRMNKELLNIYDKQSYKDALETPGVAPLLVGTLEINSKGEQVFKSAV